MPDDASLTPLQLAWLDYANSIDGLTTPDPDDTPLFQYLQFKANVLKLVRGQDFLNDLQAAWDTDGGEASSNKASQGGSKIDPSTKKLELLNLLLLELRAFPPAVKAAQTEAQAGTKNERKGWKKRLLGWGSTIVGSAKDLADKEHLPWYAAAGLKGVDEVIHFFKGD